MPTHGRLASWATASGLAMLSPTLQRIGAHTHCQSYVFDNQFPVPLSDRQAVRAEHSSSPVKLKYGGRSLWALRGAAYHGLRRDQAAIERLPPLRAFYLATRNGARILGLEDRIGSFEPGREADFVVLDLAATPLLARRIACARTLREKLLILMILGKRLPTTP